jgi:hypothetical protein
VVGLTLLHGATIFTKTLGCAAFRPGGGYLAPQATRLITISASQYNSSFLPAH